MFESEYTDTLLRLGYEPFPINGKIPFSGFMWKDNECTPENIALWKNQYPEGAGIAIKNCPAIDVDVYDVDTAIAMREFIKDRFGILGVILIRVGQKPKFLIPIRGNFDKKMMSDAYGNKEVGISRIELLSISQYWVAAGIHPGTKKPYKWIGDSIFNTPVSALVELTEDDILEIFEQFHAICELSGFPLYRKVTPDHEMACRDALDQMDVNVNSAVEKFKRECDLSALLAEKGFVPTGTTGQTPYGPSTHYTRPGKDHGNSVGLLDEVPGSYPQGTYPFSTEAGFPKTNQLFNAFSTLAWLFHWDGTSEMPDWTAAARDVRSRGFQDDIEEGDFIGQTPDSIDAVLAERLIWVMDKGEIVDTVQPRGINAYPYTAYTRTAMKFEPRNQRPFFPGTETRDERSPLTRWLENPKRKDVNTVDWQPVDEEIIGISGRATGTAYNCFYMPEWKPTDREDRITLLLNHIRYITGGIQDQYEYYLSWLAHIVGAPGIRPHVTPLLIAVAHGTGRGFIDKMLRYILGSWNCGDCTIDDLAGVGNKGQWDDYLYRTLFVTIPEARGTQNNLYEIDERLRDKLTNNNMFLNRKFGLNCQSDVFTRLSLSSNSKVPLILSHLDRRIFVFECREKPKGQAYYDTLYTMIEDPETLRQLYWYLRRWHNAHQWSAFGPVPLTQEKERLIQSSVDPVSDAIGVLVAQKDVPDLITFGRLKAELDFIMMSYFEQTDANLAGVKEGHLRAVLRNRFEQAYKGAKFRFPGCTGPVSAWIIRNEEQWLNASLSDIQDEMIRWGGRPLKNVNSAK